MAVDVLSFIFLVIVFIVELVWVLIHSKSSCFFDAGPFDLFVLLLLDFSLAAVPVTAGAGRLVDTIVDGWRLFGPISRIREYSRRLLLTSYPRLGIIHR